MNEQLLSELQAADYIDDLWFLVRRLRDLKVILIEIIAIGELTAAQSNITGFIPKLKAKLEELERLTK